VTLSLRKLNVKILKENFPFSCEDQRKKNTNRRGTGIVICETCKDIFINEKVLYDIHFKDFPNHRSTFGGDRNYRLPNKDDFASYSTKRYARITVSMDDSQIKRFD
jgi:hypothetical protein